MYLFFKTSTSGVNQNFELVAPVKILVKPGFSGTGATSSVRRRSITSIQLNGAFSESDLTTGRGENENIFLVGDRVKNGDGRTETSIQIENSVACENRNVAYYMRHCFRLMYLSGMSTYNPETKENVGMETWMNTILRDLQKVRTSPYKTKCKDTFFARILFPVDSLLEGGVCLTIFF